MERTVNGNILNYPKFEMSHWKCLDSENKTKGLLHEKDLRFKVKDAFEVRLILITVNE